MINQDSNNSKGLWPGIPDIDRAMEKGYSTASDHVREMGFGAGMGPPNMKRCSDEFEIESERQGHYGKQHNTHS